MRILLILLFFVSCNELDFLEPEDSFREGASTRGFIPLVCEQHNHIIAFDTSGSNKDESDPNRDRYTTLLDVLKNKKQESAGERFLFVEFKDNDIVINGSERDEFVSLSEIIEIIQRQFDRSRDSGSTPYIDTFNSISDFINEDSETLATAMKYSINFFTDGKPCTSRDGCEEQDRYGDVKTSEILDSVRAAKGLESKPKVSQVKIHTVHYGELTQTGATILDSIAQIGQGNSVSLNDFSAKSYVDVLSQTSFSCQ